MSDSRPRVRFLNLTVASLGANEKDKPSGIVTARVLFDGTNGIAVNRRTRIRDQERAPIAVDLKRSMRKKKNQRGVRTCAFPIGKFRSKSATGTSSIAKSGPASQCTSTQWGPLESPGPRTVCEGGFSNWTAFAVHRWRACGDLAHAGRGCFSP